MNQNISTSPITDQVDVQKQASYQIPDTCKTCTIHNAINLQKLGISLEDVDFVVALAGNPNVGKSTVFNALTGLRQHTGNWPGKTVSRAEGAFEYNGNRYKIVDLPGTYSLLATSIDEEVARDFILFGRPDVTIIVVDATRLERNLNLAFQVMEITDRVVICLNLIDEAQRHGIQVDDRLLSRELGVPVIPTAARQGKGIPQLLQAIHEVALGIYPCKPYRLKTDNPQLKAAIDTLVEKIHAAFPQLPNARWVAIRLLDGDERIAEAIRKGEIGNLALTNDNEAVKQIQRPGFENI